MPHAHLRRNQPCPHEQKDTAPGRFQRMQLNSLTVELDRCENGACCACMRATVTLCAPAADWGGCSRLDALAMHAHTRFDGKHLTPSPQLALCLFAGINEKFARVVSCGEVLHWMAAVSRNVGVADTVDKLNGRCAMGTCVGRRRGGQDQWKGGGVSALGGGRGPPRRGAAPPSARLTPSVQAAALFKRCCC